MTGDIIAGLALIVALVVAFREWKSDRRRKALEISQADLQSRLADIEEGRRQDELEQRSAATITARIERRQKHTKTQPCLVLRNTGQAPARSVAFDPSFITAGRVIGAEELPIDHLAPGGEFVFPLVLADQTPLSLLLRVTWQDAVGTHEQTYTMSRAL